MEDYSNIQKNIQETAHSLSAVTGLPERPLRGILAKFSLPAGFTNSFDLLHEIAVNLLEAHKYVQDCNTYYISLKLPYVELPEITLKLAYGLARSTCVVYCRQLRRADLRYRSIDIDVVLGTDGSKKALVDTLVGECQFETFLESKMDSYKLMESLPKKIQDLVTQKMAYGRLRRDDARQLTQWVRRNSHKLRPIRAELAKVG